MYKLKIRLLNSPVQARVVVSARVFVEKGPGWHFYRSLVLILVVTALLYGDSLFLTALVIEQESTNNPKKQILVTPMVFVFYISFSFH